MYVFYDKMYFALGNYVNKVVNKTHFTICTSHIYLEGIYVHIYYILFSEFTCLNFDISVMLKGMSLSNENEKKELSLSLLK